jgi:Beta/Gamma crystallin
VRTVGPSGNSARDSVWSRLSARGVLLLERRLPMHKLMLVMAALLFVAASVVVSPATAGESMRSAGDIPQIIAFDNENFLGDHMHILGDMKDLGKWGNSISSMVILSGTWEFFDDEDFKGTKVGPLGPGTYPKVADKGIKDNSISSIRLVSPTAASTR